MGTDVSQFEATVAETIGASDRKAVALATGGAALHVAALIAGLGPGDEVIVPSMCHLSNVQAILATGAQPVFCDVDDETLCIDPHRIDELIGPHTRAIMALDYGCYVCDHDAIGALAAAHGLRVIHDAAHSFGSSSNGRGIGTFTDICMFSFDPVKCLTAVDAGVLMLADEDEQRFARQIRILGSDQPPEVMYKNARTWDYDAVRVGYRYHLSNIHAALGISQVAKLPRIRANRQSACTRYAERLQGYDSIRAPFNCFSDMTPFLYFIRVPAELRDGLRAALKDEGIDTGLHWRPAHIHTYFTQFHRGPLPVSEAAGSDVISLPLHSAPMSDEVIDRVCDTIVKFLR
ncbi:unannotated protein [freshwater metagenome]|uniref:Unannotated protein n=1 Tax=freshwater metagenome TaxID=449393 RepID=A0A6J7AV08_9ZZZZ